jgi:hypothetical protein
VDAAGNSFDFRTCPAADEKGNVVALSQRFIFTCRHLERCLAGMGETETLVFCIRTLLPGLTQLLR